MRQDFSTTYEDFIGSILQPCKMASYIRAAREQNAIKIFSLSNRKISLYVFSLCAKLVQSRPNPANISTTRKKFKILSFFPGKDAMSERTISRYCPFKQGSSCIMSVRVDITKRKASLFYGCTFFFPKLVLVFF